MITPKKNILVYGAGSIGSFLAAKLYAQGHNVEVIGREKAKAIGQTLYINDEKYAFPKVYDEIDYNKKYDYIFVTSKYYDLKRNLEDISNSGVKVDLIVLIQNTYIDNSWYINAIKNTPFVVTSIFEGYNLEGNKLHVASRAGWAMEDGFLSKDVYVLLKNANIPVQLVEDIDLKRAEKTVLNCSISAISAIKQKTLKELFESKEDVKTMLGLFDETYNIISELMPMHSKRSLQAFFMTHKTMDVPASAYIDIKKNKKTEIYFLNGFIIELGKKMGIPTPHNIDIVHKFKEKYPDLY